LKSSERVPLAIARVVELIEKTGLPRGVVSLVNGANPAVDALLDAPEVEAISFVGSSPERATFMPVPPPTESVCNARVARGIM
jgi:acyl-CoA reductase-like NAD-dependent aldehyde dehydrogenase